MKIKVEEFWNSFQQSIHEHSKSESYEAWSFGDTPEMQNRLGKLVLDGQKKARPTS